MDNAILLPVPSDATYAEENKFTPSRKTLKVLFSLFFAVYLVSTLLGAALVPGRLELDGISFSLSIAENGAFFLCAERCFFALFLLIFVFSPFRLPASLNFVLLVGVQSGVCIRLLLYNGNPFLSFLLALLISVQILFDVFLPLVSSSFQSFNFKRRYLRFFALVCSFIVYLFVTYLLSLLIYLMLK